MATPFIVTGVPTTPGPNGSVPIRREIRDLQKNYPQQYDLFCQAMLAFQTMDEQDQLSYYQVAGIHGLPYKAWNGVTGIDGQQAGYCTHSSILFLPWHRPYLCLFEQLLCSKVEEIAKSYTADLRSEYISAAQLFRLPYWDWALQTQSGQPALPSSVAGPAQIQVTGPDGKKLTIPNPLLQYNFNVDNLSSGDFPDPPYNTWPTTLRYPRNDSPNTASDEALVNSAISSQNRSIRSQLRYILTSITTFGPFSNDKWIPNQPGNYPSLEDIHDNIHVLVGGPSPSNRSAPPGHMSNVPVAAFDPCFWLHHCNVDRVFAIFQALNPNTYVVPEPTSDGTFTEEPGSMETVTSDLTPFWRTGSTFHTPQTAQSTIPLGYAYPETQSWNYSTTALYQQSVRTAVNRLYASTILNSGAIPLRPAGDLKAAAGFQQDNVAANGKTAPLSVVDREVKAQKPLHASAPRSINEAGATNDHQHEGSLLSKVNETFKGLTTMAGSLMHQGDGPHGKAQNDGTSDTGSHPKHKEWIVNIRVRKHGQGGPFQIHCFFGPVPTDCDSWLRDANNVGTCSILGSNPTTTSCEKCKTDASAGLVVTGIIPITESLHDEILEGNLRSLNPADVEPYLAEKLHWRVTQTDGTEKRREEVDDLQVSVVSTDVTPSSAPDEFPVYSGVYTLHPACTQGRPGGYNPGDQY